MKNKKIIIAIALVVCAMLGLISVIATLKSNNVPAFHSEGEMSQIINGIWTTGNTEYDFILTIDDNYAEISMEGKDGESELIVLVPDKGYFYFEQEGDTQESRYNVVKEKGVYVIDNGAWVYGKNSRL